MKQSRLNASKGTVGMKMKIQWNFTVLIPPDFSDVVSVYIFYHINLNLTWLDNTRSHYKVHESEVDMWIVTAKCVGMIDGTSMSLVRGINRPGRWMICLPRAVQFVEHWRIFEGRADVGGTGGGRVRRRQVAGRSAKTRRSFFRTPDGRSTWISWGECSGHESKCRIVPSASPVDLPNALGALVPCEQNKMSSAGAWKQLRWSSCCLQGLGDCSRQTDQQRQKPGWISDLVKVKVCEYCNYVRSIIFGVRFAPMPVVEPFPDRTGPLRLVSKEMGSDRQWNVWLQ